MTLANGAIVKQKKRGRFRRHGNDLTKRVHRQRITPQVKSQGGGILANRIRELRIGKQIPAKDMVETVQAIYPKFDKTVLSKCENDAKYGVTISQSAMDALYDTFDPERQTARQSRTSDRHKLPRQVSCRLAEEDYGTLQQLVIANGYDTMQACLADVISQYIQKGQE